MLKRNLGATRKEMAQRIRELAQDLEARAEDIANDIDKKVSSITINTTIRPDEVLNWEITKNYLVAIDKDLTIEFPELPKVK